MANTNTVLTEQQREYYERELKRIRRGGDHHDASAQDCIWGMGSSNLGPIDPPVVAFGQHGDPFYTQYFQSWDEVEMMIAQLREEATRAWGPNPAASGHGIVV